MGRSMALKTCRSIIYWVFSGNRNYTLPKHNSNRGDARWKLSDNGAIKHLVQIGVK